MKSTMKPTSTRMTYALRLLAKGPMSCQQITKAIIKKEGNGPQPYLSGSISSKLANLVKKGVLRYADGKAEKGGSLYEINKL